MVYTYLENFELFLFFFFFFLNFLKIPVPYCTVKCTVHDDMHEITFPFFKNYDAMYHMPTICTYVHKNYVWKRTKIAWYVRTVSEKILRKSVILINKYFRLVDFTNVHDWYWYQRECRHTHKKYTIKMGNDTNICFMFHRTGTVRYCTFSCTFLTLLLIQIPYFIAVRWIDSFFYLSNTVYPVQCLP